MENESQDSRKMTSDREKRLLKELQNQGLLGPLLSASIEAQRERSESQPPGGRERSTSSTTTQKPSDSGTLPSDDPALARLKQEMPGLSDEDYNELVYLL